MIVKCNADLILLLKKNKSTFYVTFLHSMHFLQMSLQNVFSFVEMFAEITLPRFDFVSFSRMFGESRFSGKPFGADFADKFVLLETRLLNVNLKPDICCKLS